MDSEKLERYCLLEKENGELVLALSTSKAACEELHRKCEAEEEENKNLKMTLALHAEYDREHSRDTKDWHIEQLEEQNHVLETTNMNLVATLADSRKQLSVYFHESAKNGKLVTELRQKIEMLEAAQRDESNLFKYTEGDVLYISEVHKEELERLRKEIECVKAQKEDIANHSRNSENTYKKTIEELQQRLRAFQKHGPPKQLVSDADRVVRLNEQLGLAMLAMDDVDEENKALKEKLEEAVELKKKLERELELRTNFFTEEHAAYTADCEKYEKQLANINEEMTKLEELHDKCQSELKEANEKNVKMRISFANDKASFCHDMERTEEKWNAEVVKLTKANEKLVKAAAQENQEKNDVYKEQQKTLSKLNTEVEELRRKLDCSKMERIVWEQQCHQQANDLSEFMDKRKTEMKMMQTLQKKYKWLKASTRTLSAQRRCEIDTLKKEIQTLQDRCELLRKEKDEWLSELKKDVNAWKEEVSAREDLQNRIDELEKENKVLEERVEVVTEKWREECFEYQMNVTKLQELLKDKKMQEDMLRSHIKTTDNYVEQLEQKCRDHEDEFKLTAIGFEELLNAEKRETTREITYRKVISRQCMDLKEAHDRDRNKLNAARARCGAYERDIEELQGQQQADQSTIAELRHQVERLREDMGVEELEDELPELNESSCSSCSSSSCESDVYAYSTHNESEGEEEEEDVERQMNEKVSEDEEMPKLEREDVEVNVVEVQKVEEEVKKEPEEWEMV